MRRYDINKPGGIEVKGVKSGTFTLSEREIKSLLKRFDPDNYVYDKEGNEWEVHGRCILCVQDTRKQRNQGGDDCDYCPLDQFDDSYCASCSVLLENISGEENILTFDATLKGTMPVRMRKALLKVLAFLKSGKKVR